jgi:hypothetical protein
MAMSCFLLISSERAFNEKVILKLAVLPPPEAKDNKKNTFGILGFGSSSPS